MITQFFAGLAIVSTMAGVQLYRTAAVLRADLAATQSIVEGYKELSRFNAKREAADVTWAEVQKEVGNSDAGLSDYMSAASRRLWP